MRSILTIASVLFYHCVQDNSVTTSYVCDIMQKSNTITFLYGPVVSMLDLEGRVQGVVTEIILFHSSRSLLPVLSDRFLQ